MPKLTNTIKEQYLTDDFFNESIINCETFINELIKEDTLFAVYNPDSIGIVIPVSPALSPALGDIFEINIPYDLLINNEVLINDQYIQ